MTTRDRSLNWRLALVCGALAAAYSFAKALAGVLSGHFVVFLLVWGPLVSFAIFFSVSAILFWTGALRPNKVTRRIEASSWFAWAVITGFVAFFAGLFTLGRNALSADRAFEIAGLCALAWLGMFTVIWLTARMLRRRGA